MNEFTKGFNNLILFNRPDINSYYFPDSSADSVVSSGYSTTFTY
ncbi:hypothetical protein OKW21_000923 [Catalinimonas alkaloidigena]|nr:hypothetical protein [Catalinimonas alkaloidigena]